MTTTIDSASRNHQPSVSIVMAVHNDTEFVRRAIDSALSQTEANIEVICVDDASTDDTVTVVHNMTSDPRLKLIGLEANCSAYQARRVGIAAASAPYVLFLDGDDELAPNAAEVTLAKARDSSADVVGFGVEMVMPAGQGTPRFERSLQPKHAELVGEQIVPALFPPGQPAQGHLWKYLFDRELLRDAYRQADESFQFYRANDIPVSFLALSAARRYVSTSNRLYRYFFRRGTSGQSIDTLDQFKFYLSAVDSMESIDGQVPIHAHASYQSARRSLISNLVRDCLERTSGDLQAQCFDLLLDRVGALDIVLASADFCREALPMLVKRLGHLEVPRVHLARSVVVTTSHLKTGGLQGVVASQSHILAGEGIDVTVALHQNQDIDHPITPDARNAAVVGSSWAEKIQCFLDICTGVKADAVFDHHLLYNEYWPFYALAARTVGIGTIGWVHNFALRAMFNGSTRTSFIAANLSTLEDVVVLSPTDVAFWSMNGVDNAVYLPNPPSPILIEQGTVSQPKKLESAPIELVWWGRLQQSTKQVAELLKVAAHLRDHGTEFHMSIIGPDGPDLTRTALIREVQHNELEESVAVLGPLHGEELASALRHADLSLMTSSIEGFPLTLVEGQALGLPVVMYDIPWLAYLEGNDGIRTVPQKDANQMALAIAAFAEDPQSYQAASAAALDSARRVLDLDFGSLYRQLVEKQLDTNRRPSPTPEASQLLLRLSVEYSERTARALAKSRAEATSLKNKLAAAPFTPTSSNVTVPGIENFQQYRKNRSSLLRKFIAKVLPSTWKQANFIAERNAKWNHTALKSIARQQQEIVRSLNGLQQATKESAVRTAAMERYLRSNRDELRDQ
ncbi:glycosyltransferase [Brevibacterium spongiae]|uniref:Glycosyltransferase n=1 Tax=Brevibacterium spongiae TaxID=2909672 RepID=A0ABY5SR91_9MICO|nr:glycosyltransferase [Brevibacterium spongiae]UVI36665.1 glycosyltransferase [Brevibacterium spongiae]